MTTKNILKKSLYYGIEIEGIFNNKYTNLMNEIEEYDEDGNRYNGREEYNHDIKFKKWRFKGDGSLHDSGFFSNESIVEFYSNLLKSKTDFFKALKEFKDFCSNKNKIELKDVVYFNDSCGCHIHIGFKDYRKFYNLVNLEILKEFRELFFKKIKESKILDSDTKLNILNHYYRSYAREIKAQNYNKKHPHRYLEFNILSERSGKGLEWRSFNLRDIKTWKEFNHLFKICFECIEFLHNKILNGYELDNKPLKLNKKGFRDNIFYKKEWNFNLNKEILDLNLNNSIKESIELRIF